MSTSFEPKAILKSILSLCGTMGALRQVGATFKDKRKGYIIGGI